MSLFDVIYYFFINNIFNTSSGSGAGVNRFLQQTSFVLWGQTFSVQVYLSCICSIACSLFIFVLCCAFIKKIYNMCAHIIG